MHAASASSHHGHISLEDLLDELVLGRMDKLDDVGVKAVSVLLQKTWTKRLKTVLNSNFLVVHDKTV